MTDDVLVKKVFNYICGSGGFVELTALLGDSSPLKCIESKRECKNWLNRQGGGLFVVMTNGDLEGVRVQLKTKICKRYFAGESCPRTQKNCNSWHICKDFIENHCTSKCGRSHDFLDVKNEEKAKQLGIDKFPKSTIKKIVGWSLPQVCQLYLKGECSSDKCFYLHACSNAVQGFDCGCSLSHDLIDNHNKNVLKKFGLAPHKSLPIECVRCSVLLKKGPQAYRKSRELPLKETLTTFPETRNGSKSESATTVAKGKRKQSLSASSACSVEGPKNKNSPNTKEVFDCILKEYNGSVSVDTISKRLDLFPVGCGDVLKWFKEREENFWLRQENEKVFEVSVFINKVRLCVDPTCSKQDCKCFHVCRNFIAGFCRFEADCKRNHSFQYDKDRNFISKLKLGGLTEEELSKLLQLSMPQVCLKYNNAACISQNCGRIHICKSFVRKACQGGNCELGLFHEDSFMQANTVTALKRYGLRFLGRNTNSIVNMLLICDNKTSEIQGGIPVISNGIVASYEPSELKVFECLCKEFQCSASFSLISKRTDLFPKEFNDVEAWFRRKKGSFLITESDNGRILKVDAYSVKARLCLSYNSSHFGDCQKQHCSYLHVCKGYITDSCSYGATCPKDHHFQNERNKQLLLRVKLEKLTDDELRKLVMSSTPQVCTEYNNSGSCDAGYACNRIHVCSDHLRRVCSEGDNCALQHDSALDTPHTATILQRYQLNDQKRDTIKRIVLVCNKLTKSKETG